MTVPGEVFAKGTEYQGHGFFEASSMRKINNKYYFVYSSILSHELCYAVSDSPMGPFEYGGILVSIGDIGIVDEKDARNYLGNTHGGMVCINNQWYIFYHRQTNKQKCARQGCAEKIYIDDKGHINQAEITSCGLNEGPLKGNGTYEARIACNLRGKDGVFAYTRLHHKEEGPYFTQSGTDREDNPDQYIADIKDGSLAGFKYFLFDKENYISVKVRGKASGILKVFTEETGEPIGKIVVIPSDDWTDYGTEVKELEGKKALYFKYEGEGSLDFYSFTLAKKG